MKYKKIILGVALALACFSSLNANALTETKVKKTETQAAAPNVYWTDGYGRVSYTTNASASMMTAQRNKTHFLLMAGITPGG